MLNDVWGVKFQTCGNCGTSKQGGLGYGVTAQDVDWNDRDVRIIDGYGIANFNDGLNFKVGLTKLPLTRANLDDCYGPLSLDRSMFVYSAYGTSPAKFSRDLGVVAWGTFADSKLGYFGGLFQGREGMTRTTHPFSGAIVTSSIEPESNLEYVGRLHYSFLDAEAGSGYMGSYLGEAKIFTVGAGFAYEPSVVYKNVNPNGSLRSFKVLNAADQQMEIEFIRSVVERAVPFSAFPPDLQKSAQSLAMIICILPAHLGGTGFGFARTPDGRRC